MSELRLLHVHAQCAHHDDVRIVGNREGLKALFDAIEVALFDTDVPGKAPVMVSDGEHYDVFVRLDDSPWNSPTWTKRAVPYTDDYARETQPDAIWP